MTEHLEQELRQLFNEDAEQAPVSAALTEGALRRVRRRRHAQLAWATGAAAAALAAVAVVSGALLGGQPVGSQQATASATTRVSTPTVASKNPLSTPTGLSPRGPLNAGSEFPSCVEEYSPRSVTGRAFAFDGTVSAIGPARTNRPGGRLDLVAATFAVMHWYEGGSGSTVTVDITPPEPGASIGETGPSYGLGTRLLVSGEPRWGGSALADAIAWGCGFTRYYDEATANSWRAAFG
jgi:hypothetical protein